jgi:hypothetical protein
MNRFFSFLLLGLSVLISFGCGSNSSPTVPPPYTGLFSTCFLFTTDTGYTSCSSGCSATFQGSVIYYTPAWSEVTNALVVVTTPAGPVSISYSTGDPNWHYKGYCVYQSGFVYDLNIYTSYGNLSDSVTAPGSLALSSSGSFPVTWTASWTASAQYAQLKADDGNGHYSQTASKTYMTSPAVFPNSFFPVPGTYNILVNCTNFHQLPFVGGLSPLYFEVAAYLDQNIAQ